MWKRVVGGENSNFIHEFKLMRKDDDEEEFIYVPEEMPEKAPVKEPVKEPAKVPQKVGDKVIDLTDGEESKPEIRRGKVVGYRCMEVSKKDSQWMFHSPSQTMSWQRGVSTAGTERCGRDHVAPDKGCDCGLYATSSEEKLNQAYGNTRENWTVQVEGWGKVHTSRMDSTVIRAQHMQIVGLRPPKCEQCDEPASHLISANPDALGGRPTCEEHVPDIKNIKIHSLSIDDVAKELSNYYGGAMVRPHGKSWDEEDDDDDLRVTGSWARVGFSFTRDSASPFRKEFRKVRDHAEKLGWVVEETNKGWMFKAPPESVQPGFKGLVVTHGSPSDHRAFKNFLGDLKNEGGLVWPPERARQKERKQEKQEQEKQQGEHDSSECLTSRGFNISDLDGDDLVEFHQMSHEDERGVA